MKASKKLEIILSELEIKAPTLAKNIDVEYRRLNEIQRERTKKISGELATKINATYPQFSIEWLLSDTENLPAFINNNGHGHVNINSVQTINSQSKEIELLTQMLADRDKIIELLESKIEKLTSVAS